MKTFNIKSGKANAKHNSKGYSHRAYRKDDGIDALLEYREGLGELGMLTVDSVKVGSGTFEAIVHEYGIEINQHGLPRKHEMMKVHFEPQRDGVMLISKVFLDLKYFRKAKRASLVMDQDVNLAAEL